MPTKLNDLKYDCVAFMINFVAQARWAWCIINYIGSSYDFDVILMAEMCV